jgi:GNAT superfamily N-acetyltransferase
MDFQYTITCARAQDLRWLPAIEIAAALLLKGHAPLSVLNETTSEQELTEALTYGRLWTALANDIPVGFAHAGLLGPTAAHLKEIDVHPDHGRRGLGTRLVKTVCDWAARYGCASVTLSTFRDVPWNMPFYARLGFEVVPPHEWSGQLESIMADEVHRGLDPDRRVVMRCRVLS